MKVVVQQNGKWLILGILALVLILLFAIRAKGDYSENKCNRVEVNIEQPGGLPLLTEAEVLTWLNASQKVVGEQIDNIELSDLEQAIRRQPQIKTCEVRLDFKGTLSVDVQPFLPIARLMKNGGPDAYISNEGVYFPMSKNYSARVILLNGEFFNEKITLTDDKSVNLLSFLNFINEEAFWKAQFTGIEVDSEGNMEIVPLLGDHLISFGKAEEIPAKLKRLEIFYKQIYPVKGWDGFSDVSVAYAHQIVCK